MRSIEATHHRKGGQALRRTDIISGFVLIIFGLITIFVIIPDQISGSSDYGIAPDVFPLTLIWIFTLFAVFLFGNRLLSAKPAQGDDLIVDIEWGFIGLISLYLLSSFLAIKFLGFIFGGIYTVGVLMLVMGEYRHKLRLISVTLLAPVFIFLIFRYLFIILLP